MVVEITNWIELDTIRLDLTNDYILVNCLDKDTEGYDSLVDTSDGWLPISTFEGTFNGQNYAIYDLFIDRETNNVGLFGNVRYGATISNLQIKDAKVTGIDNVGILTGLTWNLDTITNVHVEGEVIGNYYVGGLAGYSRSNISKSSAIVNVSGNDYVGGFVGFCVENTISKSLSEGEVLGYGKEGIGGFVGVLQSLGYIGDCHTHTDILRLNGEGTNVGGFVGLCRNDIEDSYSTGAVVYLNAENPTNKGFAGAVTAQAVFTNCFWDIEISNQTTTKGTAVGKTTAQMKDITTFGNWDIVNVAENNRNKDYVWNIQNEVTYPFLRWKKINIFIQSHSEKSEVESKGIIAFIRKIISNTDISIFPKPIRTDGRVRKSHTNKFISSLERIQDVTATALSRVGMVNSSVTKYFGKLRKIQSHITESISKAELTLRTKFRKIQSHVETIKSTLRTIFTLTKITNSYMDNVIHKVNKLPSVIRSYAENVVSGVERLFTKVRRVISYSNEVMSNLITLKILTKIVGSFANSVNSEVSRIFILTKIVDSHIENVVSEIIRSFKTFSSSNTDSVMSGLEKTFTKIRKIKSYINDVITNTLITQLRILNSHTEGIMSGVFKLPSVITSHTSEVVSKVEKIFGKFRKVISYASSVVSNLITLKILIKIINSFSGDVFSSVGSNLFVKSFSSMVNSVNDKIFTKLRRVMSHTENIISNFVISQLRIINSFTEISKTNVEKLFTKIRIAISHIEDVMSSITKGFNKIRTANSHIEDVISEVERVFVKLKIVTSYTTEILSNSKRTLLTKFNDVKSFAKEVGSKSYNWIMEFPVKILRRIITRHEQNIRVKR